LDHSIIVGKGLSIFGAKMDIMAMDGFGRRYCQRLAKKLVFPTLIDKSVLTGLFIDIMSNFQNQLAAENASLPSCIKPRMTIEIVSEANWLSAFFVITSGFANSPIID
jgi:hypothetical protein